MPQPRARQGGGSVEPDAFMRRLRSLREAAGVSQEELADAVETCASVISEWERGRVEPGYTRLQELVWFFGWELVLQPRVIPADEGEG